ncbi:MAG: VRR-NUC domain-containing protein [Clostridiales bacterium]|nr:VRR-NUC domain-containing protein [Clostridiales bacterium]
MIQWRNESQLLNAVIRVLAPYCKLYRVNVIRMKTTDGRWLSTGVPAGYPDLAGRRRCDGRAVYIECKVKPNKPTPKQQAFIDEAIKDGCIAGVCYTPEDALRLVIPYTTDSLPETK